MNTSDTKKIKKEREINEVQLPVRIPQALADRVDKLIISERIRTSYMVSRSDILRRSIALGVERFEKGDI